MSKLALLPCLLLFNCLSLSAQQAGDMLVCQFQNNLRTQGYWGEVLSAENQDSSVIDQGVFKIRFSHTDTLYILKRLDHQQLIGQQAVTIPATAAPIGSATMSSVYYSIYRPCANCPAKLNQFVKLTFEQDSVAHLGTVLETRGETPNQEYKVRLLEDGKIYWLNEQGIVLKAQKQTAQGWKANMRVCTAGTNFKAQDFERYTIRFCGRKGFPGHAFIFLQHESAAVDKIEKNAYGFFPKKLNAGYLSVIVPVKGSMRTESTARYEYSFTLEITAEEYEKVLQIKDKWSQNPR
ncbi:MAG: hypothetical protein ACOYPR_21635, partial [Saprospiraceae bacterium]